jgi:hypothetical protein
LGAVEHGELVSFRFSTPLTLRRRPPSAVVPDEPLHRQLTPPHPGRTRGPVTRKGNG